MDEEYDYPTGYDDPTPPSNPQPNNVAKSSGAGIILLIIIGIIIWFVFLRTDYKDVWWKGTEYQTVVYCGPVGASDCRNGNRYVLPVTHITRSGDTHTFSIKFDNGGYVHTYGNCMKDASNLYPSFERYCFTTATDSDSGRIYTYLIAK